MSCKTITGVEIRLFSPLSSLTSADPEGCVSEFRSEYVIKFDDGSEARVTGNPARQSKVFNTPEFTLAAYDALSELARNVRSGTWLARRDAP